ncbi:MAG: (2Fe-2S) ferredoxin domain-containing protein [Bacillota bacterium]
MAEGLSYEQLRKAAEERVKSKRKGMIRVLVCYTSCSISVGADEVLKSMQEALKHSNISNIIIETTGCLGICAKEPLVDVYMPDGSKYSYELIDSKKAMLIILSHSQLGKPVEEYLLK